MAINYPTSLDTFTNPTATSLLTSPSHAQQHSDINDAVEALQTKVAIGNTVLGTYTAYTPTWTGLTVGNGTSVFEYARVNNLVHVIGYFTFGSTSAITGGVTISLPVNASTGYSAVFWSPIGFVNCSDASAGTALEAAAYSNATATTALLRSKFVSSNQIANQNFGATVPFTWTTSDRIMVDFTYEAA